MRLVFIHGINNQKNHPNFLKANWISQIHRGAAIANIQLSDLPNPDLGYYAQRLNYATNQTVIDFGGLNSELPQFNRSKVFSMGKNENATSVEGNYGADLIREYAQLAGVEIPETDGMTEMGVGQLFTKLVDIVQDILPPKISRTLGRPILKQAAVWASSKGLRDGIENQVANFIVGEKNAHKPNTGLGNEPVIIIGHSLGAAVAYRMLMNMDIMQNTQVPLFITIGAPLPVKFIRKSMDQVDELWRPDNIGEWINIYDKDDFVPVGSPLKESDMNFDDFQNFEGVNPEKGETSHSSGAYLRHPIISEKLNQYLA